MRYIDIYKADVESGSGYALVTQDCIQTTSADLVRKPNAKTFTMADGSLCIYTAENDSAETVLNLEVTETQAQIISDHTRQGHLYFSGMRAGADALPTPTDPNYFSVQKKLFEGCLTENTSVRIQQIYPDLFSLQIPLKMAVSDGSLKKIAFPVIQIDTLSLSGNTEDFSDYTYKNGSFCRKNVIFTSESEMQIGFAYSGTIAGLKAAVFKNQQNFLNWDSVEAENSGTLPLSAGSNHFLFQIYTENSAYKSLSFQFLIYRQPEVISW